jgi:hypothetical protein
MGVSSLQQYRVLVSQELCNPSPTFGPRRLIGASKPELPEFLVTLARVVGLLD